MQEKRVLRERTEVWGQLILCAEHRERIAAFLLADFHIRPRFIVRRMHLTVYHARRPMPGLSAVSEPAGVVVPAVDTRFMVMAPGGENPRPELDPSFRKVGIRVHKQSTARPEILLYRERLLRFETPHVLGARSGSTHLRNAFGAR